MGSIEKRINSLYKQYADTLIWVKFRDGEIKSFTENEVWQVFH